MRRLAREHRGMLASGGPDDRNLPEGVRNNVLSKSENERIMSPSGHVVHNMRRQTWKRSRAFRVATACVAVLVA